MALIGVRGEEEGRFLEVNDALCSILRTSAASCSARTSAT
jgi:hypothetical protein